MQQKQPEAWYERASDSRMLRIVTWLVWLCALIATCIAVARHPTDRTVTTNYRDAATEFWSQLPMYKEGQHGWLYPPQGAVVYSPFAMVPSLAAGEVLWRVVITGVFAWSLWRLAGVSAMIAGRSASRSLIFAALTSGSMALAAGCMRNGQMNLPLGALFLLAICSATEKKWWWTTLWLSVALACKPIALPVVMLMGALCPPLWWRLPLGMVGVVALPFVNPHWTYVIEQCRAALMKMKEAGEPGAGVFSDLSGMLQMFPVVGPGKTHPVPIPDVAWTAIRAAAALVSLAVCFLSVRRCGQLGMWCVVFFGVTYLMLFNPRTEGNSYVMFAPFVAGLCAWAILQKRIWGMIAFVAVLILLAAAHELYKDKLESVWIRPMCAAACWLFVGHFAVRGRLDVIVGR